MLPVPDQVDWPAAGGFMEAFATAHDALFTQAELRPGERLLVNGAAGGVGTAAVQLAVAAGVEVTGTARREESRELVRGLGASTEPDGRIRRDPGARRRRAADARRRAARAGTADSS